MQSGYDFHDLFSGIDQLAQDQFRTEALGWLQARIGFDGVIWGTGTVAKGGGIEILDRLVQGRPKGLFDDSADFAAPDAFLQGFVSSPETLRNIRVAEYYNDGRFADLRDHLESYRVRHILLKGIRQSQQRVLAWIGFLREDLHQPFDQSWNSAAGIAISVVLHASEYTGLANSRLAQRSVSTKPDEVTARCSAGHLTDRQKQVLHCLLQGWPNKLIARRLAITENTLKSHLQAIYQSMNVSSRSQAILKVGKFAIHDHANQGDCRFEL